MIQIEVNNKKIQAEPGEMILTALKRAGIHVPTLCYLEKLPPAGRCRICVVEVEGRGDLVTACSTPVQEKMKIHTHSPRVLKTRKKILELLLSNHPDDCLYCVRNGQCDLRQLADEMHIRTRDLPRNVKQSEVDTSSESIVREPSKCILCGRCVRVCSEIQTVNAIEIMQRGSLAYVGIEDDKGMGLSWCINCGQCVMVCPTGALSEKSHVDVVKDAIGDPKKYVVVQHAPSISVSLAEEFGLPAGTDVDGLMVAAFRAMGFDTVFDTSFSADLTIMEEGSELVHRILNGGKLPMMTSCSPGWVKFVEQFYPQLTDNVSTCKSPQQMMGAIIKSYFAETKKLKPADIFSVSIMPCTAKKFEANRPEMGRDGVPDVDAVLTTRELAELIRLYGIDFNTLKPETADNPFGERTTAGKIFGASGGVMEAALRSGYFLVTGKELENYSIEPVRGLEGIREAKIKINDDLELNIAVTSGLGNARKLMDEVVAGRKNLHFIEIMTCPGGCIAGGGQPRTANFENIEARAKSLYTIDANEEIRVSHKNPSIVRLYDEFLGKPLGEKSHKLLHTHYKKRELYN